VTGRGSFVPIMLPDALRNDFPQLEKVAAVWNLGGAQIHIPIPGKDLADERKVKVSNGFSSLSLPYLICSIIPGWKVMQVV
jgi:hypothetical protein